MVDAITMAHSARRKRSAPWQETREQEGTNHTLTATQVRELPGSLENGFSSSPASGSQGLSNLLLRPSLK